MVELCLMASHGCPLGLGVVSHPEKVSSRGLEGFHHVVPRHGSSQDLVNPLSFNLSLQQKEERRSTGGLLDSNHFVRNDSTPKRPALIDFQDTYPDSILFSIGIAERCYRHEKFLKLLASGAIEEQDCLLDLSMLYDLMGPQSIIADLPQEPGASCSRWCFNDDQSLQYLIYPTRELYLSESFLDLVGDRNTCPEKAYHPDVPLQYNHTGTEKNDMVSVISDFYSSKNTNKSSRQTLLVPYFERRRRAHAKTNASKLATENVVSPKSPDKVKEKTSRKKTGTRSGKGRDIYCNSYLYACESLLSIMVDRRQRGKTTILSLKKSGPQLPQILTQFSATIAGTGIAVAVSTLCRVACGKVPFCAPKLLSTGLGLGLVWLSWAVNRLRDTVISISKTACKLSEKEEEMMNHLDGNLKDIYFRATALMVLAVLRVA